MPRPQTATQDLPKRVELPLAHDHDPHVDVVGLHSPGQDQLELLLADLAGTLPAAPRFLGLGRRRGNGEEDEGEQ